MESKWRLLDKGIPDLLGCHQELLQLANSLARFGDSKAATALLTLMGRLLLVSKAERDLERLRAMLDGKKRLPRFHAGEYVILKRDGVVAQVVLVRASMFDDGRIIYDLQVQGRFRSGISETELCATLEEYAGYLPLATEET